MVKSLGVEGQPWTDAENDILVADYLDMLRQDIAGLRVPKAARREELRRIGLGARTLGSIERKQTNLSAVFSLLGYRWVRGLTPMPHYQHSLVDALQRNDAFLQMDVLAASDQVSPSLPQIPPGEIFVPSPEVDEEPLPPRLAAFVRKIDPAERDSRARELGKAGEAFVMDIERDRLEKADQGDLVGDLKWVAETEGDGHGYDIRSFDGAGREMHIEVKTTNGGSRTPFMMTSNEDSVSLRDESWRLYRVYLFFRKPRIFVLEPPIRKIAAMETAIWKVSPGRPPALT